MEVVVFEMCVCEWGTLQIVQGWKVVLSRATAWAKAMGREKYHWIIQAAKLDRSWMEYRKSVGG